ncbi:MgtC/SapB family protein [Ectothiorhodospiraceae bacterium 2226]|nr:MgtC/SapB family protein [Ectothiorhodospiraceae bacterium 2226]
MERTLHGRQAGFRTHALVCAASSLLMLLSVYQWELLADLPSEALVVDPTRLGQGIMTGIGFLGAGAIVKERLSVRGLTTAASIWMTAAIGIVIGMGFYAAAAAAVALALVTLSLLRWVEGLTPSESHAQLRVHLDVANVLPERDLRALLRAQGVEGGRASYRMDRSGQAFSYDLRLKTRKDGNFQQLARVLRETPGVQGFSLRPVGD